MARYMAVALVGVVTCGAVTYGAPGLQTRGQTQASLAVTIASRALQPGEVVVLTISGTKAGDRLQVTGLDQNWLTHEADASTRRALIGIDLDRKPGTYPVVVSAGSSRVTQDLVVVDKKFLTRNLTVDDAFVNPPEAVQARIAEEAARLTKLWQTLTPARIWSTPFKPPVPESPNSAFGSRSVFNGEARSPHSGADFTSPAGSTIKAPNDGQVVLAENLYFSGNTVILDHGQGLYSQFAHLSEIGVKVGEHVTTGQSLGKVGATGRVTGPHLHWAVRLAGTRVDPISLLAVLGDVKSTK